MRTPIQITYDTSDPNATMEMKRIVKSLDMAIALHEIGVNLMGRVYDRLRLDTQDWDDAQRAGAEEALGAVSKELAEIYEEECLVMEDLIR